MRIGSVAPILSLLIVACGCDGGAVYDQGLATFDPRGHEATLSAEWTINGAVSDAQSCDAAGIDSVRLLLFAESDRLHEDGFAIASPPCADGAYHSGAEGGPILAAGRYRVSLEAVDLDGEVVGQEDRDVVLDAAGGRDVTLGVADFETLTTLAVMIEWDLEAGSELVGGDCESVGVESVRYVLSNAAGAIVASEETLPCEEALYFEDLTPGVLALEIEGRDATGTMRWAGACAGLSVGEGAYAEHRCTAAVVRE